MIFSTNIQTIDQHKTVPIFFLQWLDKNSKWPPPMTKLSKIGMYLARNETQTQAMVIF